MGLLDENLLDASRKQYDDLGLPRSSAKAFDFENKFVAWGTEVDSMSGSCGAPGEKRKHLFFLTCLALASRKSSLKRDRREKGPLPKRSLFSFSKN